MPTAEISTNVREVADGVRVVDIKGEVTAFAEEALRSAHEIASADGVRAVILNFTDLAYMNSGGIGLLVTTLIRAQRSGHRLLAYGLSDHYREIFSLTRLDEAIEIFDDEEAAIAASS
ncbi:MAG: anti-sigma factor antagonist [Actinobacteria bacterium]|nr:MAG: anti-sigma factor antagonist [Actinomycetota bacterium]